MDRAVVFSTPVVRSKRKPWIDGLRAIAILFVILGHQLPEAKSFFVFTSPVKIPLFFMISGYLFKSSKVSFRSFFSNVFFSLVIPWICLTLPRAFTTILSQGLYGLLDYCKSLVAGEIAWYMPCCIIAEILFFVLVKYTKNPRGMILGVLLYHLIGMTAAELDILNVAMINRAFIVQVFLLEGYLFKVFEEKISEKFNWIHILILCLVYIGSGIISLQIWPDGIIDVHNNQYYNYFYCFGMILLGCFTLFILAKKLEKAPRVLQFIGQNTLVYYLLHSINIAACRKILAAVGIKFPASITSSALYAILFTVLACVVCGVQALLLNRFLPEVVGKKRKKV